MVLSVEGTTIPGTPHSPEYLKAHVAIPPHFLRENPDCHAHIAAIVQLYIEHVGVPTVAVWTQRARARRWPLSQTGSVPVPSPAYLPLIPNPLPNSSHYTFRGRIAGWTPPNFNGPTSAALSPSSQNTLAVYDIDELTMYDDACERIAELEHEVQILRDELHVVSDVRANNLQGAASRYEDSQAELRQRIRVLEMAAQGMSYTIHFFSP